MNTIKYLILLLVVGAVSSGGYYYLSQKNNAHQSITSSVVVNSPSTTTTPLNSSRVFSVDSVNIDSPATPTAAPVPQIIPAVLPSRSTQISPDGQKEVITQVDTHSDGTQTFSLFISSIPFGENPTQLIFTQPLESQDTITIPFDTFSPDDKYIFLQESNQGVLHYLLFQTSGLAFPDGGKYHDVLPLFNAYTSSFQLSKVTGWASDSLLIIETLENGQPSTSFWFNANNSSFTPLATRF